MVAEDAFRVLGLPPAAGRADVLAARRRLAKSAHPDIGGSAAAMRRVNEAVEVALTAIDQRDRHLVASGARRTQNRPRFSDAEVARSARRYGERTATSDHPSFVIEALPAIAFEALTIGLGRLGEVVDDDPPYRIEAQLDEPLGGWCHLRLVAEAGGSTVHLDVASTPGFPSPSIESVRDAIVAELNRLDWSDLVS